MKKAQIIAVVAALAIRGVAGDACGEDVIQDPEKCGPGIEGLIDQETWTSLFKGRDSIPTQCHAEAIEYFTLENLIAAQKTHDLFADFTNVGDCAMRKRELMSFLAETSHETNGGWIDAPCHTKSYGYCFAQERSCETGQCTWYCDPNAYCQDNYGHECPCAAGKTYHGRGPMQLSWNYNYAAFSHDYYGDLRALEDPDMVIRDGVVAFASALWFWMTPQPPKPSCHAIITGEWVADTSLGYRGGFGAVTHAINGGLECPCWEDLNDDRVVSRMQFFERYITMIGLPETEACASPEDSLYCNGMPESFNDIKTSCGGPPVDDLCAKSSGGSGGGSNPGGPKPEDTTTSSTTTKGQEETTTTTTKEQEETTTTTTKDSGNGGQPPAEGGSDCLRNDDCVANPWCTDDAYIQWCADQAAYGSVCPEPYCVWADGQSMLERFGRRKIHRPSVGKHKH